MEGELMTFKGLEKWYCKEFEKLGWVVLGVSNGHHFKALMYRHSLKHLLKAIGVKMRNVSGQDTLNELEIMSRHTQILLQYVDTTFAEAIRRAIAEKEFEVQQGGRSPRSYGGVLPQFTAPFLA